MNMAGRIIALLIWGLMGASVLASAPDRSAWPEARPLQSVPERPDNLVLVTAQAGVKVSLRPVLRPNGIGRSNITQSVQPTRTAAPVAVSNKGSICGKRSIRGERLSPIPGRLNGCGVQEPVRVYSVAGVTLSQASIMDCTTAKVLDGWVGNSVKPTIGRLGGGIASLQVVAHYACRTRNSKPGAKISEHGKGHAIDISAFNLQNGLSITVLQGWRDRAQGKILRSLHQAACGPFGTVLGPKSDRHHQDHFHLDTARYRSGSYCR